MGISLKAMWNYKCPRCRQGDLFVKPFTLSKPLAMNHSCHHCNLLFEPEPGYYYGAMFLSYIVFSLIMLPFALLLNFYFKLSVDMTMLIVILLSAVGFFRILRGARSLWIHIMVRYKAE
jgi:uncharacterized protein (DUF983 family)